MKNKYRSTYSDEYFSRDTRRVPMWKSEADFKNLFSEGDRDTIRKAMEIILTDERPVQASADESSINSIPYIQCRFVVHMSCLPGENLLYNS